MKVFLSQVHWGRVLWADVLIVLLTLVLNLVVVTLLTHVWNQPEQVPVLEAVAVWSSVLVSLLVTFVAALWVARQDERTAQRHGFLVGLIAAILLFLMSSGFQGAFALVTQLSSILTIVVGWLAGVLVSRRRVRV